MYFLLGPYTWGNCPAPQAKRLDQSSFDKCILFGLALGALPFLEASNGVESVDVVQDVHHHSSDQVKRGDADHLRDAYVRGIIPYCLLSGMRYPLLRHPF